MEGVNIKIELQKLVRHYKMENRGKGAPYLWVVFFKIDGTCVDITPAFRLSGKGYFENKPGSHGNLGITSLTTQKTIPIPTKIGEWRTRIEPFHIPYFEQKAPGMTGAIVVMMEENNVSYRGAEAGHQALNKKVEIAVNQALKEFDPRFVDIENVMPSIKKFFEDKVAQTTGSMQNDIISAIKSNQRLLRNLWTYFNPDSLIGFHVWNFNQKELIESPNQSINFSHSWTANEYNNWEIFGKISIIEDKIPTKDVKKKTQSIAVPTAQSIEIDKGRLTME